MIPGFAENLHSCNARFVPGPSLAGTHFGPQRWWSARRGKRCAAETEVRKRPSDSLHGQRLLCVGCAATEETTAASAAGLQRNRCRDSVLRSLRSFLTPALRPQTRPFLAPPPHRDHNPTAYQFADAHARTRLRYGHGLSQMEEELAIRNIMTTLAHRKGVKYAEHYLRKALHHAQI